MKKGGINFARALSAVDTRFLPFADAASADLPLGRLFRLSLFQLTVGMAAALVIGTLNRVMIVEMGMAAWLVSLMLALPLILAPFRTVIGFKSDHHRSVLGWRRVPYIWLGTMLQFGGLSIMPFALLLMSEPGGGAMVIGQVGAAVSFLLVGAGMHTAQTVGLALAADMAPEATRPRVVAMMCSMLLVGMVVSALIFGVLLSGMTPMTLPQRLIQVIQGAAFVTMLLNSIALWKQEPRDPNRGQSRNAPQPKFRDAWRELMKDPLAARRLTVIGIGAFGFSMQDVLLEPYGGQVLHLPVAVTTAMTALLAIGGLTGYIVAARGLTAKVDAHSLARWGVLAGLTAVISLLASAPFYSVMLFAIGTVLIGFGTGLFLASTLSLSMGQAKHGDSGLALGAWGAVQASAAGLAIAFAGAIRDGFSSLASNGALGDTLNHPATGYGVVYCLELVLLLAALIAIGPMTRAKGGPDVVQR